MSIYDNSGWFVLVRAHDHVWADKGKPIALRVEVCTMLHRLSLEVDPAEALGKGE